MHNQVYLFGFTVDVMSVNVAAFITFKSIFLDISNIATQTLSMTSTDLEGTSQNA